MNIRNDKEIYTKVKKYDTKVDFSYIYKAYQY